MNRNPHELLRHAKDYIRGDGPFVFLVGGDILCRGCLHYEWRDVVRNTLELRGSSGWCVEGIGNPSGDECCPDCGEVLSPQFDDIEEGNQDD